MWHAKGATIVSMEYQYVTQAHRWLFVCALALVGIEFFFAKT
ncbi:MAG: hypothetical protein JWP13_527 [Candidatus Saccharibacteria bacterium]|nr:hypothetical protein [Candidatus Saccharibacteria bacterium]